MRRFLVTYFKWLVLGMIIFMRVELIFLALNQVSDFVITPLLALLIIVFPFQYSFPVKWQWQTSLISLVFYLLAMGLFIYLGIWHQVYHVSVVYGLFLFILGIILLKMGLRFTKDDWKRLWNKV